MIVLEEWKDLVWPTRLVVLENGRLAVQWLSEIGQEWHTEPMGHTAAEFPLFAPTKTPRPPAPTSSRRKRSPRG